MMRLRGESAARVACEKGSVRSPLYAPGPWRLCVWVTESVLCACAYVRGGDSGRAVLECASHKEKRKMEREARASASVSRFISVSIRPGLVPRHTQTLLSHTPWTCVEGEGVLLRLTHARARAEAEAGCRDTRLRSLAALSLARAPPLSTCLVRSLSQPPASHRAVHPPLPPLHTQTHTARRRRCRPVRLPRLRLSGCQPRPLVVCQRVGRLGRCLPPQAQSRL